jgi:hypothetical protein
MRRYLSLVLIRMGIPHPAASALARNSAQCATALVHGTRAPRLFCGQVPVCDVYQKLVATEFHEKGKNQRNWEYFPNQSIHSPKNHQTLKQQLTRRSSRIIVSAITCPVRSSPTSNRSAGSFHPVITTVSAEAGGRDPLRTQVLESGGAGGQGG